MFRKILPHAVIVMALMYVVFFFIDRVNSAMAFINNGMTKGLLLIMCICAALNAVILIVEDRGRARNKSQNRRPTQPGATYRNDRPRRRY